MGDINFMKTKVSILFSIMMMLGMAVSVQAADKSVMARPTQANVSINGQPMNQMDAYNIGGSNYFKLRDVAMALKGTKSSFDVAVDTTSNAIRVHTGQAYTPIGGELEPAKKSAQSGKAAERQAIPTSSKVYVDGTEIQLTSYNIGGSNYFQLRELGEQLHVPVLWRALSSSIHIIAQPEMAIRSIEGVTQLRTTNDYHYGNWFEPAARYLFLKDGQLNLLQWDSDKQKIHIQQFNKDYTAAGSKTLNMELPKFGGFHQGEDGNYYLVFGQDNMEESSTKAVYRVVKYNASWDKLGQVDVSDVYVSEPFRSGNVTMDSANGKLVVQSTRLRYKTAKDGLRHQSNMTFTIDMAAMKVLSKSGQFPSNHVSHSFATYVRMDGDRIVYADHGDAYPRSIVLQVEQGGKITKKIDLINIPGKIGDNYTGANLGGLEVSASSYLAIGANSTAGSQDGKGKNVFLSVVPKNAQDQSIIKPIWLTQHTSEDGVFIRDTYISKINDNKFVLLWTESSRLGEGMKYAVVDGQGTMLKQPTYLGGVPSPGNMMPLVQDQSITWYYANPMAGQITSKPSAIEWYTLRVE